jgi:hypothetical protein
VLGWDEKYPYLSFSYFKLLYLRNHHFENNRRDIFHLTLFLNSRIISSKMKSIIVLSFGFSLFTLNYAHPYSPSLIKRVDSTVADSSAACATGIHMIVARASTEAPGEGIIGAVATMVKNAVPGSDSEAVVYPATLTSYTSSEASGVAAMTALIQAYVARCPSSKIALLGYSQVCWLLSRMQ